jgi:hypothetical protein
MSQIHEAAYLGKHVEVSRLLAAGTSANALLESRDGILLTPLHCALTAFRFEKGQLEIVDALLHAGARVSRSHIEQFTSAAEGSSLNTLAWILLREHAPHLGLAEEPPWMREPRATA